MRWRPVLLAAAATAVAGAGVVLLVDLSRSALEAWRPATCLPAACFCEAVRAEGLAQPVNTLTSLAYVLLGVWALAGGVRGSDLDRPTTLLMRGVGVALVLLGLGSALYHGTLTFAGQVLDVQGMYVLGTLLVTGALVRRGSLPPRAALWVLLVATGVLLVTQVAWPDSRRLLFGLVLVPGIVLEALPSTTGRAWPASASTPFRVGLGLLAAAYLLWVLDATGVLCDPTSPWQGHGAWHVLTAAAAVLVVAHYARSGPPSPPIHSGPNGSADSGPNA
jgi:hypothetical protein